MTELEIRAKVEANKKEIISILETVKRPGMDGLINWLCKYDYFTAPASTMYHSNYEGGLAQHSLNVYRVLKAKAEHYTDLNMPLESVIICGLLHDLCKVNFYVLTTRNKKDESTGKWVKVPFYKVDDQVPLGHGEKSIIILSSFINLTLDEMYAIRAHMGGYEPKENWNTVSGCWNKNKWAVLLHTADLEASYLYETHIEY